MGGLLQVASCLDPSSYPGTPGRKVRRSTAASPRKRPDPEDWTDGAHDAPNLDFGIR